MPSITLSKITESTHYMIILVSMSDPCKKCRLPVYPGIKTVIILIIHIINLSVTTILSRLFLLWSDIHEIQWNDDCYLNRDAKFITNQLALQVFTKIQKWHHIMFSVSLGSFKEVKKRPFMLIETHRFSIFGAGAVSCSSALCLFSAS